MDDYAMVRGHVVRVTELGRCEGQPEPGTANYVVANCVATVKATERTYTHAGGAETSDSDEVRIVHDEWSETIGYTVDINLLRVDPQMLSIVSGNGYSLVDYDSETETAELVGYATEAWPGLRYEYALEVWSRLGSQTCNGERLWGYTLFPRLRQGSLSGFDIGNGLTNLNINGASCLRGTAWGAGPYAAVAGYGEGLFGLVPFNRHETEVVLSAHYNQFWFTRVVTTPPPAPGRYDLSA